MGLQLATLEKKAALYQTLNGHICSCHRGIAMYCFLEIPMNILKKKTLTKPYDQSILGQKGQQIPRPWEAGAPPPPMPGLPQEIAGPY